MGSTTAVRGRDIRARRQALGIKLPAFVQWMRQRGLRITIPALTAIEREREYRLKVTVQTVAEELELLASARSAMDAEVANERGADGGGSDDPVRSLS